MIFLLLFDLQRLKMSSLYKEGMAYRRSSGMFLVRIVNNMPHVLLVRNRTTYDFMNFLNAWINDQQLHEEGYLESCFGRMTAYEKSIIASENFDIMWEYAFCSIEAKRNQNNRWHAKFNESKRFIESLWINQRDRMVSLCKNTSHGCTPLNLPRGKRNRVRNKLETHEEAAIREVQEETRISANDYVIIYNEGIRYDIYEDDGYGYDHTYIIAQLKDNVNVPMSKSNTSKEISGYRFYSLSEVEELSAIHPRLSLVAGWLRSYRPNPCLSRPVARKSNISWRFHK